jgi:hypothetical protein
MGTRINLDGEDNGGRKVEFLDQYQLWCYVMDPFRMYLPLDMQGGPTIVHFNNAMDFYIKDTEENRENRLKIALTFNSIASMSGTFASKYIAFGKPPSAEQKPSLTLSSVQKWIDDFGGANGRLNFFSDEFGHSLYFKKMALPLLSMKSTGSITVERVAKPLKNGVLDPARNRLGVMKQIMCLRAGLNLNMRRNLVEKEKKDRRGEC